MGQIFFVFWVSKEFIWIFVFRKSDYISQIVNSSRTIFFLTGLQKSTPLQTPTYPSSSTVTPRVRPTDFIKHLQQQHEIAYNLIKHSDPTQLKTNILEDTRRKISDECRQLQTNSWNQIIQTTDLEHLPHHHRPRILFKSFKRFQGNHKQALSYIKDHHNNKIHDNKEVLVLFHSH